jgi:hypothetical protein
MAHPLRSKASTALRITPPPFSARRDLASPALFRLPLVSVPVRLVGVLCAETDTDPRLSQLPFCSACHMDHRHVRATQPAPDDVPADEFILTFR